MSNLKTRQGLDAIIRFIEQKGALATPAALRAGQHRLRTGLSIPLRRKFSRCRAVECPQQSLLVKKVVELDQSRGAIVQHQPLGTLTDRNHGMCRASRLVFHDQNSQLLRSEPGFHESRIFQHGKLLAIARAGSQCGQRRRPTLHGHCRGSNSEIGCAIYMGNESLAIIPRTFIDNRDKPTRRRARTTLDIGAAFTDDLSLTFKFRLQFRPYQRRRRISGIGKGYRWFRLGEISEQEESGQGVSCYFHPQRHTNYPATFLSCSVEIPSQGDWFPLRKSRQSPRLRRALGRAGTLQAQLTFTPDHDQYRAANDSVSEKDKR